MTPTERIAAYREAYEAANGKPFDCHMVYISGWYRWYAEGYQRGCGRASEIDEMTQRLLVRAAQAIEARRAETGTDSVHESAVRKDAP